MFTKVYHCAYDMGLEEVVSEKQSNRIEAYQTQTLCVHTFSDLAHVSPVVFLYLLKECYLCGTIKATKKFRALQQQVHLVLGNAPQPGPATFVIHCLYVLPIFGLYCEGFSHLIISALCRFHKTTTAINSIKVKKLAAQLFLDISAGSVGHDTGVTVKIIEAFDIGMESINEVICQSKSQYSSKVDNAIAFVERYIIGLLESESYLAAVTLLERFSIRHSTESFLIKMVESNEFRAAEKWATFMGRPMLCELVQEYAERNMLKNACETIKKNNLKQDFPEIYHKCKESSLKNLAEKGCWDIAESKAKYNRQLLEYLVYLAMEAGYSEKVDELCNRYSLGGFIKSKEAEVCALNSRFLCLADLALEDINWVDEVNGLQSATSHLEECKVVGIDCEWKPNYVKGSKPNKVSIMQLASDKKVFVVDLIKLYEDAPDILDNCLARVFQSSRVLKLGYNFQCDVKQLAHSYGGLECFKQYEMLLDIQNLFKESRGGLSGLAKSTLGVGLNKTRRNSNWEERPLTQNQLEYAALDAAVLVHIFHHFRGNSQPANVSDGHENVEWKSHIVPHIDTRRSLNTKVKNKSEVKN